MIGLMVKDFLVMRKTIRSYLLVMLVYTVLAIIGAWSADFVGGFLMTMVAILPMNTFAYDKQAKWDVYGLTFPVGRTKTVAARYLAVLLLAFGGLALAAAAGLLMGAMGKIEYIGGYLLTCAVCGLLAMLMNAVLLPILYKFGPERARIMLYGMFGIIVLAGWAFLIPLKGLEWLKTLGEPTPTQIAAIPFFAAAVALVLLLLSFLLSRHIYENLDV